MLTGTKLNNLKIKEKKERKNINRNKEDFLKNTHIFFPFRFPQCQFEALNQRGFK